MVNSFCQAQIQISLVSEYWLLIFPSSRKDCLFSDILILRCVFKRFSRISVLVRNFQTLPIIFRLSLVCRNIAPTSTSGLLIFSGGIETRKSLQLVRYRKYYRPDNYRKFAEFYFWSATVYKNRCENYTKIQGSAWSTYLVAKLSIEIDGLQSKYFRVKAIYTNKKDQVHFYSRISCMFFKLQKKISTLMVFQTKSLSLEM